MFISVLLTAAIMGAIPGAVHLESGVGVVSEEHLDGYGVDAAQLSLDAVFFMPIYRSIELPVFLFRVKGALGLAQDIRRIDRDYTYYYEYYSDSFASLGVEARFMFPFPIPFGLTQKPVGSVYTFSPFAGFTLLFEGPAIDDEGAVILGTSLGLRTSMEWRTRAAWWRVSSLSMEIGVTPFLFSSGDVAEGSFQGYLLISLGISPYLSM